MKQPSPAPNDKVTAAGVAGAFAVIIAWALGAAGLDVPPGVEAAFAVIIAWVAAYFREERGYETGAQKARDKPTR